MIITNSLQQAKEICTNSILRQTVGVYCYIPIETSVLVDREHCYDENFINDSGIPMERLENAGGCIVAFPDNLEIGHFSKNINNTVGKDLAKNVVDFLTEKGLNASVDNNDVLIDGTYKVFSFARAQYNWIMFTAIHVSINCDADLVSKICTKPMVKIPKGLSNYGITTEEMLALLEAELEKG